MTKNWKLAGVVGLVAAAGIGAIVLNNVFGDPDDDPPSVASPPVKNIEIQTGLDKTQRRSING